MQGTIVNYRRGRRTQTTNQMIIEVENCDSKEKAAALVGKTVTYVAPGKNKTTLTGKVSAAHGAKGVVRAIFDKGMPGQAIGQKVEIA